MVVFGVVLLCFDRFAYVGGTLLVGGLWFNCLGLHVCVCNVNGILCVFGGVGGFGVARFVCVLIVLMHTRGWCLCRLFLILSSVA